MKKSNLRNALAVVAISIAAFALLAVLYNFNPQFHGVFVNRPNSSTVLDAVTQASPQSIAAHREKIGLLVFIIFATMVSLQFTVFGAAITVCSNIKKGGGTATFKLKQLESAGIFFDLPLYCGLFGTVASFMVIAFSSESSLLMAYSTTLLGIIFTVILHVTVLYPVRRRLLREQAAESNESITITADTQA